jgi:hypothetical protein
MPDFPDQVKGSNPGIRNTPQTINPASPWGIDETGNNN